jgi:hypothetical protein
MQHLKLSEPSLGDHCSPVVCLPLDDLSVLYLYSPADGCDSMRVLHQCSYVFVPLHVLLHFRPQLVTHVPSKATCSPASPVIT